MGAAGRAWFPSHFSSIMLAGYGCVGMGHAGFLGKWGGEREGKNSGKNFKNILLLPCLCICRGEAAPCRSKWHRAVFFFFKKRKTKFGSDPKLSYDSCPPLYNAYGAKTLRSKLVKKTKGKKMIWLSWATCPHMLTVVYFQGQPAHILILVYFHGRPAHTRSHWSIFMGDLPKYSKWSIFRGDQPTHSH